MNFLLIITCAINGYIYSEMLIKEGHLLHGIFSWIERKLTRTVYINGTSAIPDEVLKLQIANNDVTPAIAQRKVAYEKKHWLIKVLGGCQYCTTGQLMLWAFIFYKTIPHISPAIYQVARTAWHGVSSICAAILLVLVIERLTAQVHQ